MNLNATILGQTIAFVFFVIFCMKYVWPPIMSALTQRQEKISDGLAAAERAHRDLDLAQDKVKKMLREAKQEASSIIDQANQRAGLVIDEAKVQAKVEAERIVDCARTEAEGEYQRVKDSLRDQLGSLVVLGAERLLEDSVNDDLQAKLVDQLVSEL